MELTFRLIETQDVYLKEGMSREGKSITEGQYTLSQKTPLILDASIKDANQKIILEHFTEKKDDFPPRALFSDNQAVTVREGTKIRIPKGTPVIIYRKGNRMTGRVMDVLHLSVC